MLPAMETTDQPETIQLHLVLPYKFEAVEATEVKKLIEDGYRILHLQRVSDQEALVTLTRRAD